MSNVMNKKDCEVPALISECVIFEGKVSSAGLLRVEGILIGDVKDTQSLIIGETGSIEGNIHAETIVVFGKVTGNLSAKSIILKQTATVAGGLRTQQIIIEKGAVYTGDLFMQSSATLP